MSHRANLDILKKRIVLLLPVIEPQIVRPIVLSLYQQCYLGLLRHEGKEKILAQEVNPHLSAHIYSSNIVVQGHSNLKGVITGGE